MKTNRRNHLFTGTGLMFWAITIMTGCSGHSVLVRSYPPENIIHMDQLKALDSAKALNTHVVYANEGDSIPLALSLESEFMALKQEEIDIIAKQKLYFMVRMPENLSQDELEKLSKIDARTLNQWSDDQRSAFLENYMIYVSRDAVRWAPMSSIAAMREVLGYNRGSISFGMSATTRSGLGASLGIKTIR